MNYRVRRQGAELGTFSFEELQQRRASGEFNGSEYVRCDGKFDWQPINFLLQYGPGAMPPPVPNRPNSQASTPPLVWIIVGVASLVFLGGIGFGAYQVYKITEDLRTKNVFRPRTNSDAMTAASKPVTWTAQTKTAKDVLRRSREFRVRQWIEGYAKHGKHDQPWDANAVVLLKSWIQQNYGGTETNLPPASELSQKLEKQSDLTDPLLLTAMAMSRTDVPTETRLLERALPRFADYDYQAYPHFYALLVLATETAHYDYRDQLEKQALEQFKKALADGSFTSDDQGEVAELLLNGWAKNFFSRHQTEVCNIAQGAGKKFAWLALVLEGQHQITEAWNARGSGYVNTVSQKGWQGFRQHLSIARKKLTEAWNLHPDLPEAADLMIYVSLGDSDITEMRVWFDRAVTAQIDYRDAWSNFRWGLRPRWYGSHEAMLALGVTALNTGRFDTDVPRMYFDSITDVESEMELSPGEHIYGRDDIWPNLKRLYEGYIVQGEYPYGWRSTYTAIAYYAEKYDVARAQFEALNWEPDTGNFVNWNRELSLMPLEVAARTGPAGEAVTRAEDKRNENDITKALAIYRELERGTNSDTRTREFIGHRIAELELEQRLQNGEWIDLLPKDEHDLNWVFQRGKARVLADGALEVESGQNGHLLFSRVRTGAQFEVRGEFEVVRSSNNAFQAGLVMGLPDAEGYIWNAFRMGRNETDGDHITFTHHFASARGMHAAKMHEGWNEFTFKLEDFKATATVNGQEVLRNVNQPHALHLNDEDYMLGLGGYHNYNETVIRYRNVQVHRLGMTPPAPAKEAKQN